MSSRKSIDEIVKRKLYAESMGRCMNPACCRDLFSYDGDVAEKAHIEPYCDTADNSFENLVILCPNCHTDFDKNHAFTPEEVLGWKKARKEELEKHFGSKYVSFEALRAAALPLLLENHTIFTNYYTTGKRELWDKAEGRILANNKILKTMFSANLGLFQRHKDQDYSNLSYVLKFISHVDEFEVTRLDDERIRQILFPAEINSMFGIVPVEDSILPSVESLELFITKLRLHKRFVSVNMSSSRPYLQIIEDGKIVDLYLDDTPRIRQYYNDYNCFRSVKFRLDSLVFIFKYLSSRGITFNFPNDNVLREITMLDKKVVFVYEYCLSCSYLMDMSPDENSVVVNLHNWNGDLCISTQAYDLAESMNVTLLTSKAFLAYVNKIKNRHS